QRAMTDGDLVRRAGAVHAPACHYSSMRSVLTPRPPSSTLFPYTTLFRSRDRCGPRRRATRAGAVRSRRRAPPARARPPRDGDDADRKSTRLNSSHVKISYAVFCLKKKKKDKLCDIYVTADGVCAAPLDGS